MSELRRYIDCGAVFAENLGSKNSKYTYTGTSIENSPFGRARTFNGTSDKINYTHVDKLIVSQGTFACKIKTTSSAVSYVGSISYTGSVDNFLSLGRVDADGKMTFYFRGGGTTLIETDAVVNDGNWHDVVVISDGSEYFIYVDGVSQDLTVENGVNNGDWVSDITETPDTLAIGNLTRSSDSSWFDGSIKEVIIDDRAWTQQEVTNYHTNKVWDYDRNIISRWNLDSTSSIKDMGWKNLGNDGTVSGSPASSSSIFCSDCVDFDGTDDEVDFGSVEIGTNVTICFWAKIKDATADATSILKIGSISVKDGIIIDDNVKSATTWRLGDYDSGDGQTYATGLKFDDNKWHHYTYVKDNGSLRVYLDGEEGNTITDWSNREDTIVKLYGIGNNTLGGVTSSYFKGRLDKLIAFNKVLTPIEIKDLMARQLRGDI